MKLYKFESEVDNINLIDKNCEIYIKLFCQDYDDFDKLNIICDNSTDFNLVYKIFINFYVKSIIQ